MNKAILLAVFCSTIVLPMSVGAEEDKGVASGILQTIESRLELGQALAKVRELRPLAVSVPGQPPRPAQPVVLVEARDHAGHASEIDLTNPIQAAQAISSSPQLITYKFVDGVLVSVSLSLRIDDVSNPKIPIALLVPLKRVMAEGTRKVISQPAPRAGFLPAIEASMNGQNVLLTWQQPPERMGRPRTSRLTITNLSPSELEGIKLQDYDAAIHSQFFSGLETILK